MHRPPSETNRGQTSLQEDRAGENLELNDASSTWKTRGSCWRRHSRAVHRRADGGTGRGAGGKAWPAVGTRKGGCGTLPAGPCAEKPEPARRYPGLAYRSSCGKLFGGPFHRVRCSGQRTRWSWQDLGHGQRHPVGSVPTMTARISRMVPEAILKNSAMIVVGRGRFG